jgi:cellulose synthase/poly-beta-1,6-N-acetylglucosamine synthase-like glycosyltransferase
MHVSLPFVGAKEEALGLVGRSPTDGALSSGRGRELVGRSLALVACAYAIVYLLWRVSSTLNPDAWVVSLALLAAEAQGMFSFGLFTFIAWDVRRQPRFELPTAASVDVYVPTYGEELEVLEATLVGCRGIRYAHQTYVLDDARRPEVAALAARMGCHYLTRPDNRHAKAGNINAALMRTRGEFVVILDADTVPQPEFLHRTLGYFVDDRMAVVQLPQEFYNLDSLQHRGAGRAADAWHEQALFFRVIQRGKNRWNAAFWCGSPSVLRRRALEDVRGVATDSITEDLHTSLRLHGRGWKSVYHSEPLAYGIAPQTLEAFCVQRLRWAQGTMQILRSRENPVIAPGLSLAQRLNYIGSTFTYFEAAQKLVFLLVPAVVLVTGALPLSVDAADYVLHWLPFFALGMLANIALGRGTFRVLDVERFNVLKMFVFLWAITVLVWPRRVRFKVTPKSEDHAVYAAERRALLAHLIALAIVCLSVAIAAINLVGNVGAGAQHPDLVLITMLWALVNALLLTSSAVLVLRRLYNRSTYRFPIRVATTMTLPNGRSVESLTDDLSRQGCALLSPAAIPVGTHVALQVAFPHGPIRLNAQVLRSELLARGGYRLGVRFRDIAADQEAGLVQFLFVVAVHQQQKDQAGPRGRGASVDPLESDLGLAA